MSRLVPSDPMGRGSADNIDCMEDCCAVQPVHAHQRRVLSVVLAINAAMFLIEIVAALLAHSTALLSDAVDMLGDALVYAFSLYVIGRGATWQARSAMLKATSHRGA